MNEKPCILVKTCRAWQFGINLCYTLLPCDGCHIARRLHLFIKIDQNARWHQVISSLNFSLHYIQKRNVLLAFVKLYNKNAWISAQYFEHSLRFTPRVLVEQEVKNQWKIKICIIHCGLFHYIFITFLIKFQCFPIFSFFFHCDFPPGNSMLQYNYTVQIKHKTNSSTEHETKTLSH